MKEEEKTKIFNEIKELKKKKTDKEKKEILKKNLGYAFMLTTILFSIVALIMTIIKKGNLLSISNNLLLFILLILFMLFTLIKKADARKFINIGAYVVIILLITLTILPGNKVQTFGATVPYFGSKTVGSAMEWAKKNKITYTQIYEFSDSVKEFDVISQDIEPGTKLDKIRSITFTVSSGPNLDKLVVLPNMIGWNLDDVLKYVSENKLTNINIDFTPSTEFLKDTIITQNTSGSIRRNTLLSLSSSTGDGIFKEIKMLDFKNRPLFEAKVWLGRNIVKHTVEYAFNKDIKRGNIISQSIEKDANLTSEDTVIITVSKGKEIIVPDFSTMKVDEITKWIVDNKLRVKYDDVYHESIEAGKLISSSIKTNDIIEEETEVTIVISKGQLRMGNFTNINDFRAWALKYSILTEEVYEYNDIAKGNIIKFSHKENDIINITEPVIVYISQGKAIAVPNFSGKTSSAIRTECSKVGLNCTFVYGSYSTSAKDIALSQNKTAGSTVISGTSVTITLSKGIASSFTIEINESQLSIGNADQTINSLKSFFASKYPDVTFVFIKQASNVYPNAGFIHESSPIKDGSKVTQGKSYNVWITN